MRESLAEIVASIRPIDAAWQEKAAARTAELVMPPRALGRLHEIGERLCAIARTLAPRVGRKAVLVMAADHGVAAEGVSAYPQEVTGAMVRTFLAGGAGINVLARQVGAAVWVADMGIVPEIDAGSLPNRERLFVCKIGRGTRSLARGPAMSRAEAERAVRTGFELASRLIREEGVELLATGDMGIGNTTAAAAVGSAIVGASPAEMVGRGTGVDDAGLARKRRAVEEGLAVNRPDPADGLDVLAKVGGFEIGGIAGTALAGAFHRTPVVVDGFISTAGALVAATLCPAAVGYLFAGHRSEEPGHGRMLAHLGLAPILDLGLRLGEGTGAALAMGVIEAAARVIGEVMTFEQAGVPTG